MLSGVSSVLTVVHAVVWLVFLCMFALSLLLLFSQAARTSSSHSFKNNVDALVIGIAYVVVVSDAMPFVLDFR